MSKPAGHAMDIQVLVPPTIAVKWHCACGASLVGAMPKDLADTLLENLAKTHTGPGHGSVTARKAGRARRKMDRPASGRG